MGGRDAARLHPRAHFLSRSIVEQALGQRLRAALLEFRRQHVDKLCRARSVGVHVAHDVKPVLSRLFNEREHFRHGFSRVAPSDGLEMADLQRRLLRTDEYRRFEGKSVAEIAQTLQKDPFDTLFDLLAAEQCNTGMIDCISDEEDVKDILRAPFSGVISDATYPSGGRVHPRVYGTFARLIEKYVVQERVLTLEQAVHKVTGHAADRFGFEKKGVIAAGMDADLLLFSPENVREHGTYARPNLPATGFDEVFVLGERVIENGVYRGGSSGEMLGARMGY